MNDSQHDTPIPTTANRFDLNVPLIMVIGAAGALWILVIVIFLTALTYHLENRAFDQDVASKPIREVVDHELTELGRIEAYRWVDQEKGTVAIPIERAMQLYVQRHGDADPVTETAP